MSVLVAVITTCMSMPNMPTKCFVRVANNVNASTEYQCYEKADATLGRIKRHAEKASGGRMKFGTMDTFCADEATAHKFAIKLDAGHKFLGLDSTLKYFD